MEWRPKYKHVYVVYRVDLYKGAFTSNSIKILKVLPTSEAASAEVERLQTLRRARLGVTDADRTQYYWQQAHMDRAESQGSIGDAATG